MMTIEAIFTILIPMHIPVDLINGKMVHLIIMSLCLAIITLTLSKPYSASVTSRCHLIYSIDKSRRMKKMSFYYIYVSCFTLPADIANRIETATTHSQQSRKNASNFRKSGFRRCLLCGLK